MSLTEPAEIILRWICSLLICVLRFLGLLMARGFADWTVPGSALEAAGHCGVATRAAGLKDAELRATPEHPADFQ